MTESNGAICCEPALPRRRKHPEMAYRSHEVLGMANGGGESSDSLDNDMLVCKDSSNRARSGLRSQPRAAASPRSKSVDPYLGRRRPLSAVQIGVGGAGIPSSRQQLPLEHRLLYRRSRLDPSYRPPDLLMTQSFPPAAHVQLPPPVGSNGPIKSGKSSSKVLRKTTEYRSQFAWPKSSAESISHPEPTSATATATAPRKSISMGAIQAEQRLDKVDGDQQAVEEEIIVAAKVKDREKAGRENQRKNEETVEKRKLKKFKTEYKSKFRAPSKYTYTKGCWQPMSRSADSNEILQDETVTEGGGDTWYGEVAELRRKAGEYKCRSVVGNFPIPNSRQEMIEQVSQRSNLSALALATTPSSGKQSKRITTSDLDSTIIDGPISGRTSQILVRHHLERTTPTSGETGVFITSPTRDHKLEPVPLQRNRGSKKEGKTKSVHRSSSKATDEPSTRASSITPTGRASVTSVHKSPKRTARPMSMIVPGTKSVVNGSWNSSTQEPHQKSEVKQARPTTLATGTTARPKTAPVAKGTTEAPKVHGASQSKVMPKSIVAPSALKDKQVTQNGDESCSLLNGSDEQSLIKKEIDEAFRSITSKCQESLENSRNKEEEDELRREIEETIKLKSPPEPTRVKSPEQIIVKSPETVNWTIPLETRIKWTSGPTKIEDDSERVGHGERIRSPPMMTSPVQHPSAITVPSQPAAPTAKSSYISGESSQLPRSPSLTSPSSGRSLASDVLEKARTRFDQFWGKSKDK